MGDGDFQVIPKYISNKQLVFIQFEEDIITLEQFWLMKQLEEEYMYEQLIYENDC